jgi:hypothetical protein
VPGQAHGRNKRGDSEDGSHGKRQFSSSFCRIQLAMRR